MIELAPTNWLHVLYACCPRVPSPFGGVVLLSLLSTSRLSPDVVIRNLPGNSYNTQDTALRDVRTQCTYPDDLHNAKPSDLSSPDPTDDGKNS